MTLPRGQQRRYRESEARSWSDEELEAIEQAHAEGMSVQQIVETFTARGLLPRSVRVGRKGKHRGSQGLYPATAVRQIDHIRRLMHQGFTMEEIQKEFLFVRGDIDALSRQLKRVYEAIEVAVHEQQRERADDPGVGEALNDVRELGKELVQKLEAIERRLTMRARMARAAV
jgi:hypothetical protein